MRHFPQLGPDTLGALFHSPPAGFTGRDPAPRLAAALGGSLYLPALRPALAADIARCHAAGAMSMICCLEDAIRDDQVAEAEQHLMGQLRLVAADDALRPLLFVRVRTADQVYRIAEGLGDAVAALTGFVLPKFTADDASLTGLKAVGEVRAGCALPLYAMPILESRHVADLEHRAGALLAVRDLLDRHRDTVLAVRVGATDLSGRFGLRRPVDLTVWDLGVVAGALADIVNVFARADAGGYVVTGPVFEYFNRPDATASLLREARLDLANGMLGKTVIHPDQLAVVHAASVVSHEEFRDATAVLADPAGAGGVLRSEYGNKMNEVRPHLAWAGRTVARAEAFGVAQPGVGVGELLTAAGGAGTLAGGAGTVAGGAGR